MNLRFPDGPEVCSTSWKLFLITRTTDVTTTKITRLKLTQHSALSDLWEEHVEPLQWAFSIRTMLAVFHAAIPNSAKVVKSGPKRGPNSNAGK